MTSNSANVLDSDYLISIDDGYNYILCDASAGDFTVTLPDTTTGWGNVGYTLNFSRFDNNSSNIVTIQGSSNQTIQGNSSVQLNVGTAFSVVSWSDYNWYQSV